MNARTKTFMIAAVLASALAGIFANGQLVSQASAGATRDDNNGFTDDFFLEDCHFSSAS